MLAAFQFERKYHPLLLSQDGDFGGFANRKLLDDFPQLCIGANGILPNLHNNVTDEVVASVMRRHFVEYDPFERQGELAEPTHY